MGNAAPLQPGTRALLTFLRTHPEIRNQIRAAPDRTLLYAGSFFKPIWQEIADYKRTHPEVAQKETLPDVLMRVRVAGSSYPHLLAWAQDLQGRVPWNPDGFTIWRSLSGIFASNAIGAVSFQIGSGVSHEKVLVATEVSVLARNPQVDPLTKDMLAYFQRCIQTKQTEINFGFVAG
jgi:hypothetical protein